ncbi:hypothetical protein FB565_005162 [Actinoplanes lutulentus]|nr:hypothetical protein [Actinoplanes lutulentus]
MFGVPLGLSVCNQNARRTVSALNTGCFDHALRGRVLLPAVVRQLRVVPMRGRLTIVFDATSARPQTDDETR